MTVTNDQTPNFYRYKEHMDESPGCFEEDKCCYWTSLRGRAEMWDNEREAFHKGNYKECTGWSFAQRGAWLISCLIGIPTRLLMAGCGVASAACCLGCGTYEGACGCVRSIICCCDETSQKTCAAALICLTISCVCCGIAGCSCGMCVEETAVSIPTMIAPECTLSMNLLGCLHKQEKVSAQITEKSKNFSASLR